MTTNNTIPEITLYFDLVSPFSYIAFQVLRNSTIFRSCKITYTPVSLRTLLTACGNPPPIMIKNKQTYINHHRLAWSRRLRIPMTETVPSDFPFPTAEIQALLCLISDTYPEKLVEIVERLYTSVWAEGDSACVTDAERYRAVIMETLGKEVLEALGREEKRAEGQALLEANTLRAIEEGAFGLPWLMCTSPAGEREGFWGVDHLGLVAEFLGLDVGMEGGFRVLMK
ncbi:2-hydroxychromene-2-carboxylate isomerase [Aspergillus homomorphus CBS 101889]|uniref:Glutathione S-transferase kappa n=1 Tax=Aspergillus homomorphus (strain CBS 101889) TaxID=1450537 RepID=A0A395HR53_ASPHC|nr:2-hydroxychromene-2-carboxylate isomerase [Aspergillus homomorphus CBS 101889]RAL08734.1 2-hydroxychromene-2-carboxylate isomerase [Aspergillus homomorphus CBS 101889]